ncbi:MAG: signal peptidase I [Raoultibacter sp.]
MDAGNHADQQGSGFTRSIIGLVIAVALIFGFAFVLREYVVQGYSIPSGSMESTIMTGDTVFSEQVSYFVRDIERGDIITFKDPEIAGRVLIKRVIATGGQTVDIHDGLVYIDDLPLSEPYVKGKASEPLRHTLDDISYPYVVPEGYVWVMGDNRTNSQDSRYFGAIPEEDVYGRAFMVYWPLNHFGILE